MPVILRRRRLGKTSCDALAQFMEHDIEVVRNDREVPDTDFVFRWGTTSNIGEGRVLNSARAIHQVNDKLGFRRTLNEHELCPRTWFNILDQWVFPCVIRPSRHAQGRNLFIAHNAAEAEEVFNRLQGNGQGFYAAELIDKVAEYRVGAVQGRAAWVANKVPGNPDDVAWNVARGGRFENVRWDNWPLKAVKTAIQAFNLSELDFGGVDVMVDAEGNCYVLEINSAPSLTSEYRQRCTAKCFDYILDHGKDRIPLVERRGGYRKFIHPAVCERAEVA